MRRNTEIDARRPAQDVIGRCVFALVLTMLSTLVLLPGSAQAWWNEEWTLRKKITIDTSSTGSGITDSIGTVPVLVRLHIGNFRFAGAKEDGSDLRFVSGDDKSPLKFHIEKYDAGIGEALVWVSVPNIQPGAKADVWLYYGNQKAPVGSDAKGSYGADTSLVYHFATRGSPAQDSSVWLNNAQNAGQAAEGSLIGTGLRLDGSAPIIVPATASLQFAQDGQLTLSLWIKPASLQRNAVLYSRREGSNGLIVGIDDGAPFVEITVNGAVQRSAAGAPVAPGGWHHIAVVASPGLVTLYLDGASHSSLSTTLPPLNSQALIGGDAAIAVVDPLATAPASSALPAAPSAAPIGNGTAAAQTSSSDAAAVPSATDEASPVDPSQGTPAMPAQAAAPAAAPAPLPAPASAIPGFAGEIDEFEIARVARSAGYIKAVAINQGTDPSKFIGLSVDEETGSWLSGYFGVLLKSVTFDGWVVIGILLVMAVASWMVMVEKNVYLGRQRKGNASFSRQFRALDDDLVMLLSAPSDASKDEKAMRRNSSLWRLYEIGAEEIQKRDPTGAVHLRKAPVLNAEGIASIRAALDAGLVREMQALNKLMVILTIAISGGPFLGLLGTVIGVMITFAAIAMSGDVNINAIAPGVAGALMATVAGLLVAIPALFGYNYLSLGIRDLTSDMQVFIDEFTTKMAEAYSSSRPDPLQHRIAAE